MKFTRVTGILGGILLAVALAGGASAADTDFKETFRIAAGDASPIAPLDDLEKLRARGPRDEGEASTRVREAAGPILLIFLLRQNRFADGINIQQPVIVR